MRITKRITKRMWVFMGSTVTAAAVVIPGASILGAQVGAQAAPTKTKAVVHLSHSPMHTQAMDLTGKVIPNGVPHKVKVDAFSDGCNHNYGTAVQCVPLRAPDNKPVTCTYLVSEGFLKDGLLLRGKDTLGLIKAGATYRTTQAGKLLTHC